MHYKMTIFGSCTPNPINILNCIVYLARKERWHVIEVWTLLITLGIRTEIISDKTAWNCRSGRGLKYLVQTLQKQTFEFIYTLIFHRNTKKKYQVMRFTSSVNVDFSKWTQVKMERENNMKEFRGNEEDMPKLVMTYS